MKRIILCGGGTAGHVMPSLALIPGLRRNFDEIHYVGSTGGIEKELVKGHVEHYHEIDCVKLHRSLTPKNLTIPYRLTKSVLAARKILDEVKPDVVFSKGGYVSLPICLAVKKEKLVLHESDRSLGLANKLAVKKCDRLLTSFPVEHRKAELTGSPLRRELYLGDKERARRECGLNARLPYLLVVGGSTGASAINDAIIKELPYLTKRYNVIHVTGKHKATAPVDSPNYYQTEFLTNVADYYALADLCISRGGANALFELVALAVPALIIPLPKSKSSRGDQVENARYFEALGCVRVLDQEGLPLLIPELKALGKQKNSLISAMKSTKNVDGTSIITEILAQYA